MKGLHIIFDGNNTAYRANCTSELYTKKGVRTSAIMGVLNITHSTIEQLAKKYKLPIKEVIYAWDSGHSTRRKEIFPEYKANRKKKEQTEEDKQWLVEFFNQANILHDSLPYFGIKSYRKKAWEGDDLVYALSEVISEEFPGDISIIVSTDEDFHQLIFEGVHLYSPVKQTLYTPDNYMELMGIPQELFLTYKIIKGDSSDGIPGITGIGEKIGKDLVNKYGNMEQLLASKEQLMKSKRTAKIFTPEGLQILARNNQLINLKDYVDFTEIKEDVVDVVKEPPIINKTLVKDFLMKYQLVSILSKYHIWLRDFEEIVDNFLKE